MLNRKPGWIFVAGLLVAHVSILAVAQEWLGKPFKQWSKAEAEKVLNESPWVRNQEVLIRHAGRSTSVAGGTNPTAGQGGLLRSEGNTATLGGARAPVDFTFTLRLRSALPIRQALVRLKQIDAHYDQLPEKDQAAVDARFKGLLDCPACTDNYVLTLTSRSKEEPGADAIYTMFAAAKVDDIKRYITIANERGEQRPLVHFVPPRVPGEEATFFFARLDEKGVPLFTSASKELLFNITNNEVNMITNFKVDLSKLVLNGKLEF